MPLFLMPFDSVPSLLGINSEFSQVFPAVLIFSVIYVFRGVLKPRGNPKLISHELVIIFSILAYLLLVTLVNFFFQNQKFVTDAIFFKQLFSLLGGLLIYLSFRTTVITPARLSTCVKWLLIVLTPVVIYQVFLQPSDYVRAKGFSTEPSHFGNFLVFFALPAIFLSNERGPRFFASLFLCNLFILSTVSLTAVLSAGIFYLGWFLANRALSLRRLLVISASLFIILGSIFLSGINFEYLFSNASAFSSEEAFVSALSVSGSLVDRLYSFWGPAYGILSGAVIFGAGVGGDFALLPKLITPEQYEIIASVRSGAVGVSSFFGKVMTWGGIPLTGATVIIFSKLFWKAGPALRACVVPVFVSSFFSMGALVVPYIWFWVAFLVQSNQRRSFLAGNVWA